MDDDQEAITVTFRTTRSFLDDVDETWSERGFKNRSEFIRYILREAVETRTDDRDGSRGRRGADEGARDGRAGRPEAPRGRGRSDDGP